MHTLQITKELGVELLVFCVLPDAQETVASSTEGLRNCCQEQQQARKDELHLGQSITCAIQIRKRRRRGIGRGDATAALSWTCGEKLCLLLRSCCGEFACHKRSKSRKLN